ncbi:MAG TPA: alkaline shock response membrane anchor protein AmaP [Candidatus Scatovivens faecipullorum]|nr:alkaline shock response membrane anchor protein AmaP [Candidatus Scatovivens faecipullorum]
MKFLDKLVLKIFSLIILIIAIGIILIMTGILPINAIINQISFIISEENSIKTLIIVLAVLMLLAIKGIFFTSKTENKGKEGIVLENNSGKLVISKESLENLIASVTKEVPGADTVASKTIVDKNKNLIIYVTAVVSKDVMIKDVSNELQQKIKEAMRKTADLEVKEVNIKIKNITSKKVKGLPPSPVENNNENSNEEDNKSEENKTGEE